MSKNTDGFNADEERAPPSPYMQAVMAAHASLGSLFDLVTETDMKLAIAERDALERGESVTMMGIDWAKPDGDESSVVVEVTGVDGVEPVIMSPISFLDEGHLEFKIEPPVALPTPELVALCDSLNGLLDLAELTDQDQLSRGFVDLEATRQTPLPRRFQI